MEKLPPMISVFFWKDNTWHDTFVEYGMVCTCRVTSSSNPNLWYSGTTRAGLLDLHSRLKLWRSGHWVDTFVARWSQTGHTSRCQRSGWSPSEAWLVHGSYGPRETSRRKHCQCGQWQASSSICKCRQCLDNWTDNVGRFWEGLAREVSLHPKMRAWQYHAILFRLVTLKYMISMPSTHGSWLSGDRDVDVTDVFSYDPMSFHLSQPRCSRRMEWGFVKQSPNFRGCTRLRFHWGMQVMRMPPSLMDQPYCGLYTGQQMGQ